MMLEYLFYLIICIVIYWYWVWQEILAVVSCVSIDILLNNFLDIEFLQKKFI